MIIPIITVLFASAVSSVVVSTTAPFSNSTLAAPTNATNTSTPVATAACALVSISSRVQLSTAPRGTPTVAASLARECLDSIPLNKTAAIALVDAIEPYLEWQSDSTYKADPPATYFYPPHNIFTYLASVKTKLQNNTYAGEYAFQEDLYQVFARGHDGHFVYYPDALTKAFEFGRQRSLVSISEDGTSLPVIKIYEDIIYTGNGSTVTQINGMPAAKYVANFAYTASFNQDADAAYNSMFYEKAFAATNAGTGYFQGGGRTRFIYPGDNTTFTFVNGTTVTYENVATVTGNFIGVTDGSSFYASFCNPLSPLNGAAVAEETTRIAAQKDAVDAYVPEVLVPGYPSPVAITNDSIVSGYYLNGAAYEDVAVLSVLEFENESPVEFQDICQKFLADAVAAGKKKLVIDLSGNGGGYILQGYDLFRQLFPDIVQDGDSRWRTHPAFLAISEIFSKVAGDFDPNTPGNASNTQINEAETPFNYQFDFNTSNQPFLTFEDKFAPHVFKDTNYTSLMRWNLNDPLVTSNAQYGFGTDITGYRSRTNFTQPFEAQNIIMLTDGYCASTCTLFAEFMRTQGGVKSIAMGGRPQESIMQAVGGIKGAQILSFTSIYSYVREALKNATTEQAAILNKYSNLPQLRALSTGINVRDQILPQNEDDGLPAQYSYESANCRLYYTQAMITDVTALWEAAADAAFNGKTCNFGGFPAAKRDPLPFEKHARGAKRAHYPRRAITKDNEKWISRHGQKVIV